MNTTNRRRYIDAMLQWEKKKYPNTPSAYLVIDKTNDKNANSLTKCVTKFLQSQNHFAERVNTMGVYREGKPTNNAFGDVGVKNKGIWTTSQATKGSADIHAQIKLNGHLYAVPVKIEVKWGKDRQSEAQKAYQANVEQAGGIYVIVHTFDGFIEWYDEFMNL